MTEPADPTNEADRTWRPDPERPMTWFTEPVTLRILEPDLDGDTVTVVASTGTVELARITMPGHVVRAGTAIPPIGDVLCQLVHGLTSPSLVNYMPGEGPADADGPGVTAENTAEVQDNSPTGIHSGQEAGGP